MAPLCFGVPLRPHCMEVPIVHNRVPSHRVPIALWGPDVSPLHKAPYSAQEGRIPLGSHCDPVPPLCYGVPFCSYCIEIPVEHYGVPLGSHYVLGSHCVLVA